MCIDMIVAHGLSLSSSKKCAVYLCRLDTSPIGRVVIPNAPNNTSSRTMYTSTISFRSHATKLKTGKPLSTSRSRRLIFSHLSRINSRPNLLSGYKTVKQRWHARVLRPIYWNRNVRPVLWNHGRAMQTSIKRGFTLC